LRPTKIAETSVAPVLDFLQRTEKGYLRRAERKVSGAAERIRTSDDVLGEDTLYH
jgi:hypothetical protein